MFSEPWSDFCIEVKVHKKEEKSLLSSFSEISERIISEMNILSGTDGIPMSFGILSPVFLQPNQSSFFLSQEIKWIICLSYHCFYSCLFSGILNFLILGRPLMREGLSRRTFPVFLFVCVCLYAHSIS